MWVVSESDKYIATTWGSTVSLTAGEPVQETPVQTQVVEDLVKTLDVVIEATSVNLEDMAKGQLEEHGRTMGMELDKRKKKAVLIEEIKAAQ